VRSEAPAEAAGDMHEFVDKCFFFIFGRHFVKDFGDNLYSVRGGQVKDALPNFAQSMDARDGAAGFAATASDAENELGHDMVEFAFFSKLVNLLFDFWRFIVLDWQTVPLSEFYCAV